MRYRLHVIKGANAGTQWDLPEGQVLVAGRDLHNALCLPDLHVSRRHFQVVRQGNSVVLTNLSRTNGTFVNGSPVQEVELQASDRILAGETLMEMRPVGLDRDGVSLEPNGQSTIMWMPDEEEQRASDNINFTVNALDADFLRLTPADGYDLDKFTAAAERLQMLQKLSTTLVSEFDPDRLMELLLDSIFEVIPADRGYIFTRDPEAGRLVLKAARERGREGSPEEIHISYTLVMRALNERIGILSADTLSDDRFKNQGSIILSGIRSAMCVPMIFDQQVLGLLHVDSKSLMRQFAEDDLTLLTVIANQGAISLRNSRLRDQIVAEETTRAALSSYLPPPLLERIIKGQITLESEAQQVEVSVLFADIRGFTKLSENLAPSKVMDLLNVYCSRMANIVFAHNGMIDKYIGDAIMAVFGSPEPEPQHARRALECAIAMQQAARELSVEGQPVYLGVGVHTGMCVQGNIGHAQMMQFTAVGDTVNTASRLCSAADRGQIIASVVSCVAAGIDDFHLDTVPPVELKGKSQPLAIYQVRVPSGSRAVMAKAPTQEEVKDTVY